MIYPSIISILRKARKSSLNYLITKLNIRQQPKYPMPLKFYDEILNGIVAYNSYGGYFVPNSSIKRPAAQEILKGCVYEPETISYMQNNCGCGDIIHAGTYFGDFIPALSSSISTDAFIWAFEPNFENFRCAQITIIINDLKNVKLFNYGIGDKNKTELLLVELENGESLGGSSRIVNEKSYGKTIEVDITRIDNVFPKNRKVSILHLDVEGYEKEALAGGIETIRRCKPILILEDNNNVIESDWFQSKILAIGYRKKGKIHNNNLFMA